MRTLQEALDAFRYHKPSQAQTDRITKIRIQHKNLVQCIFGAVPDGPDRTAALRKLHECMMTCNKAIVLEPGTETPDAD